MISKEASESDISNIFSPYGTVEEVAIMRMNGVSRGCAFVKYAERSQAETAIQSLNGIYQMPNAAGPLVVKFADSEKVRQQKKQTQAMMMTQGMPYGYPAVPPPMAAPNAGYAPNPYMQQPGALMYGQQPTAPFPQLPYPNAVTASAQPTVNVNAASGVLGTRTEGISL